MCLELGCVFTWVVSYNNISQQSYEILLLEHFMDGNREVKLPKVIGLVGQRIGQESHPASMAPEHKHLSIILNCHLINLNFMWVSL